MRDPDLVLRAERAASALERAWDHWRVMHGLDTGPMPPMTSYVGYSSEAPWGQPRVVFGVPAEEAERLAALLNGHDCVGPVHAGVSGRPDWRWAASDGSAVGRDAPLRDSLGIPAQRQQPAFDLLPPSRQADAATIDAAAESAQVPWPRAHDADPEERAQAAAAVIGEPTPAGATGSDAGVIQDQPEPPLGSRSQLSGMLPAVPMLAVPNHDLAGAGQTGGPDTGNAAHGQPESGRRRETSRADEASLADQVSMAAEARDDDEPAGPAEYAPLAEEVGPSPGPGNRGRRYQGFPPRYQSGPVPKIPSVRRRAAAEPENAAEPGTAAKPRTAAKPGTARPATAARPGTAAKPGKAGAPTSAGEPAGEQEAVAAGLEHSDEAAPRKPSRRTRPRRAGAHDASGRPKGPDAPADAAV